MVATAVLLAFGLGASLLLGLFEAIDKRRPFLEKLADKLSE